jgi:hypothetical protein
MKHLFIFIFLVQIIPLFGQTNSAFSGNFSDRTKWVAPRNIWDGVNILDGHVINVPDGKTFYSGKITFTGTGKLNLNATGKWMPNPALSTFKNCKDIIDYYPMSTTGVYTIDPDGVGALSSISCYCEMVTDGGGWTLVLNYLHKGGTNPVLKPLPSSLPILNSTVLGNDESLSATAWGHAQPSFLNIFIYSELRFFGQTSNTHGRVIHFKTTNTNTKNYFNTGQGSVTGINTGFTTLTSHNAFLPNSTANYFYNEGNFAMTNFPFWLSGTYHWGIRGHDSRWEVDDFPGDGRFNTYHQIWIR